MLDPWIIEEIRRREEEERHQREQRPVLDIQIEPPSDSSEGDSGGEKPERGVTIVDFTI